MTGNQFARALDQYPCGPNKHEMFDTMLAAHGRIESKRYNCKNCSWTPGGCEVCTETLGLMERTILDGDGTPYRLTICETCVCELTQDVDGCRGYRLAD